MCAIHKSCAHSRLFKSFTSAIFGLLTRFQNCFGFQIILISVTSHLETRVWSGVCPAVEFLQPGRSQHKPQLARGFIHLQLSLPVKSSSSTKLHNLTRHFLQYSLVAGTWNNTLLAAYQLFRSLAAVIPSKAALSWGNKPCNTLSTALLTPSKRDRGVRTATSHWNTVLHLI